MTINGQTGISIIKLPLISDPESEAIKLDLSGDGGAFKLVDEGNGKYIV